MFCIYCGKEIADDSKFCTYCGKTINNDVAKAVSSTSDKRVGKAEKTGKQSALSEAANKSAESNKSNSGIVKSIICVAICLVLLIVGGAFIYKIINDDMLSGMSNTEYEAESHDKHSKASEEDKVIEEVKADEDKEEAEPDDSEEIEAEVEEVEEEPVVVQEEVEEETVREEVAEPEAIRKALNIVDTSSSSKLNAKSKDNATYDSWNVCDGRFETAWVEGVDGSGSGESLTVVLDEPHVISDLIIYNGYLKTKRRYAINGQVTRMRIDYNNGYYQDVQLNTMYPEEEEYYFAYDELNPTAIQSECDRETDRITFTILEAERGSKYEDTAISEIEIYGY